MGGTLPAALAVGMEQTGDRVIAGGDNPAARDSQQVEGRQPRKEEEDRWACIPQQGTGGQ